MQVSYDGYMCLLTYAVYLRYAGASFDDNNVGTGTYQVPART
jgi:hypothetical protein